MAERPIDPGVASPPAEPAGSPAPGSAAGTGSAGSTGSAGGGAPARPAVDIWPAPVLPGVRRRADRDRRDDGRGGAGTPAGLGAGRRPDPQPGGAATLLGPGGDDPRGTPGAAAGPTGFRTPFREDAGTLYLIDQRRLPDVLEEYPCRFAGEVAFAIREMIVRGAPAIGQVAAIGLAMAAEQQRDGRPYARRATLRGCAQALNKARPTAVNLRWAVERVMARYEEVGDLSEDGGAIADAMRAEADAIVFEATTDHGRLSEFGLGILPVARRPSGADPDPLQHRAARLRPVRHGARRGPGRPPRRAAGPRLGRRDAALPPGRPADDLGARPGRRPARAAPRCGRRAPDGSRRGRRRARGSGPGRGQRRHRQQGRHLHAGRAGRPPWHPVLCLRADQLGRPRDADGSATSRSRSGPPTRSSTSAASGSPRPTPPVRNPAFDVTPAELISGIVTEEGVVPAPFDPGLADATERAACAGRRCPGSGRSGRRSPGGRVD